MRLAAFTLLILMTDGCPDSSVQQTRQAQVGEKQVPYQRFVPVRWTQALGGVPWPFSIALDTKTGQLCKTYEFDMKMWNALPRCIQLFNQYP